MQKKESRFTKVDKIIIFFCLAGACFSAVAFWQEYNNILVKLDEDPVGIIVFRKGVAQRRFIDRAMWDRLQNATPVYNGDIIRTMERSEAAIILGDAVTHLSLDERTMIQIFYDARSGANIDFAGGNLGVYSENNEIMITSGSSAITVSGQTRMNKVEEGFVLSVIDGLATFNGAGIEAGGILVLDAYGEPSTKPIIAMTSFGPSAFVLGSRTEAVPVVFSWNTANFDDGTFVIVEIARDRGFNQLVETRYVTGDSSVAIYLESGSYWWRVFPVSAGQIAEDRQEQLSPLFPSGQLEVVAVTPALLRSPPDGEEFTFRGESAIPLSWSVVEGAFAYLVEISANSSMSRPVVSRQVEMNSVVERDIDFGRWYWRITPVFPPMFSGSPVVSAVNSFTVIQGSPVVAEPVLNFPEQNGNVYIGSAGGAASSRLFWTHDRNAESWLIEVADNPQIQNPVIRQNTAANHFLLSPDLLQEGRTWYWRVTALGGESPAVSAVRNFRISPQEAPDRRPVLAVVPVVPPAIAERIEPLPVFPPIIFGANVEDWNDLGAARRAANEDILSRVTLTLNADSSLKLRIKGHANPVINPANTAASNREQILSLQPLSEMRARAVKNRITERGIDPARLEYTGLGGQNPLAAWEDVSNWWRNRRVELILVE